ncbi:hypothetical protein BCR42DRAFT_433867 [Absidia repens]|uniref:Uncharacterized protein n=1 Tax=Absidia repens TaxID=90262 RepID=A0A1X2IUS3_9FUNG|nr:hypothetical protein BCR42DRAFT_433867 [Absidia repens]
MNSQCLSIARVPDSLLGELHAAGVVNTLHYINFTGLRTWGELNGAYLTEQIPIYAKTIIADDRTVSIKLEAIRLLITTTADGGTSGPNKETTKKRKDMATQQATHGLMSSNILLDLEEDASLCQSLSAYHLESHHQSQQ